MIRDKDFSNLRVRHLSMTPTPEVFAVFASICEKHGLEISTQGGLMAVMVEYSDVSKNESHTEIETMMVGLDGTYMPCFADPGFLGLLISDEKGSSPSDEQINEFVSTVYQLNPDLKKFVEDKVSGKKTGDGDLPVGGSEGDGSPSNIMRFRGRRGPRKH